jgi:hypothetical protein
MKTYTKIFQLITLLAIIGLVGYGCGSNSNKNSSAQTEENAKEVDVCRCLTEPGDSKYMIENSIACRDAISRELGVENWEKVNMSQNPEISRKFDALAARCTSSASNNTGVNSNSSQADCVGNQNCIEQIRQLVNGAGYEIADEKYAGEGIFYITAFKYGPGDPVSITYIMDCNCKPLDVKIGNNSRSNSSSEKIHRCGRRWNGSLYEGGTYGDYCSMECYVDNYPD